MSWLRLAFANLGLSPLTTTVNVVLMALGTASIVLLLLVGAQLAETLSRDAKGIDLVIGAKGSPVQLVLSAVYHADVPTGNISEHEAERWAEDPRVKKAIPVSLGDSYLGFRIVGTTHDYASLYGAEVAQGKLWSKSMEVVVGSAVHGAGLELGTTFSGVHGLQDSGEHHDAQPYLVAGVLTPTGTVLDRLILTSSESVWDLHDEDEHEDHADHDAEEDHEITAMLLSYATPLAAITLPREVNANGELQAAAPAVEISRVLQLVGVGFDGLRAFSWVLILTAALSTFAALYGSLQARKSDLAMLRCLGATRWELLLALLLEGLILTALGVVLGFLVGHTAMELLGGWLEDSRGVRLTGWTWLASETALLFGLVLVGIVAAAIPALQAYRADPARILAEG